MMVFIDETTKGRTMNFSEMTRDELRKLAAEAQIPGRSKMNKAELAEALEYTGIGEPTSESETAAIFADPKTMSAIAEAEAEAEIKGINAMVTRDAPGTAYVNLDTTKTNVAVIVREGRRWVLQTSTGETMTIRARSIGKAVKAWAKRLGLMLDDIVIEKEF